MSTETFSDAPRAGLPGQAFSNLLQAVGGLRNRRAVVAMLGCTFVGVLVAGLLLVMTPMLAFLAGLLAAIVWFVAIATGINAAGLLQMDHARGISPRSTADALVYGLMCIPKLIVLALAFLAVEIAVFVVIAILLLICKIPLLGPVLFTVVFPASVVVAGLTIVGLFICLVLSLPAIWQGASISRALAQTLAIVRGRLVEAVLLLVLVGFIGLAVGLIVFGVFFAGLIPTVGMSYLIVGLGGLGVESITAMSQGGDAHAIAGLVGGELLWAVAASLVSQVYLLGLSIVYLRVTEGLDVASAEESLRATLDDAKRRTSELGEKARQATQRGDGPAGAAAAAGAAGAAASAAPPAYAPPPAFAAARSRTFEGDASASPALHLGEQTVLPAAVRASDPDIALPFDDLPGVTEPTTGVQSDWTPLPPPAPPAAPPAAGAVPPAAQLPPAAPLPPTTTCPQCLSTVAPEDAFCGVCGYRLK
ncbi:MAG: hypothetical protein JO090_12260 [Rhizobacter sp.]|nr:hypothetical protein [Rhizobacter sp.]